MKIYIIKHKGKTWFGNFYRDTNIMSFSDGDKINFSNYFFRKKDAVKYLKTFSSNEFLEVISAEVDKSNDDNRREK